MIANQCHVFLTIPVLDSLLALSFLGINQLQFHGDHFRLGNSFLFNPQTSDLRPQAQPAKVT